MTSLRDSNLYISSEEEHSIHGTWLSVDVVAFTTDSPESRIALIKRGNSPHRHETTLPGGLLAAWNNETVEEAARRILKEKAGIEASGGISPVKVVSDRNRDERGHTVSIVVATTIDPDTAVGVPGAVYLEDVPGDMPFGHSKMVADVTRRLATNLLVDPELTYTLLGNVTTAPKVSSILRACGVTPSASRSRLERSSLYRPMEYEFEEPSKTGGRPSRIFARV